MEFPLIYGHPRSGVNFVAATVKQAFLPDLVGRTKEIRTGHWARRVRMPATPGFGLLGGQRFYGGEVGIYVFRDGRDVAANFWNTKELQHPSWADLSFSEFLRRPLDWRESPGRKAAPGLTIVEHWYRHVEGWHNQAGVLKVRYEELLDDPAAVLGRVAAFVGREIVTAELPEEPCGPFGRTGGYGDWKDVFGADDLEYFFSIVPPDYGALYEKEKKKKEKKKDGNGEGAEPGGSDRDDREGAALRAGEGEAD